MLISVAAGGGAGFSVVSRSHGYITGATAQNVGGISVTNMQTNQGWPDPARPGVPLNPDRDGWHWLMIGPGVSNPFPVLWYASGDIWEVGEDGYVDAADISTRWRYLGPCLTPAEVAAEKAAAFKRWQEAMRKEVVRWWGHTTEEDAAWWSRSASHIEALPVPEDKA